MIRCPFAIAVLVFTLCGCGGMRSTSPYTPPAAAVRDPAKAQRLTLEAAELIHTKPEMAERLLREALAADVFHGPAHNNLGVLLLAQNRPYEAANEFEWARKLMPGHPEPRMNLGLVLERAGQIDKALDTYGTALEVYPGYIPTVQALVRCQLRYNRVDARTVELLKQIALDGETARWRDWAREQLIRLNSTSVGRSSS